jgi:hypothetical protein
MTISNEYFLTTEADYHRDRALGSASSAALARKARAAHRRAERSRRHRNAIATALHLR